MTMRWKPILIALLLVIPLWISIYVALAQAQTPEPLPTPPTEHQAFKELMCRMVIADIQSRGPTVQLYRNQTFTWTDGTYGLLTGFYSGDRGTSVHGPTLDNPKEPRFLKNGMTLHNDDVARMRQLGSDFRQGACDKIVPDPDPVPMPKT